MKSTLKSLGMPIIASVFAIIIGALIVLGTGYNPLSVYGSLVMGAFGNMFSLGTTLAGAVPLILTGLGIAIAFRAGLFNIGADGQYWVGAIVAVWLGYHLHGVPGWLHMVICLVAAMVAGGLWGGVIPGLTKAYVGAHEVISTMMMSYIGIDLAQYLIEGGPMQQKGSTPQSPQVDPHTFMRVLIQPQLTTGIIWAVVACIAVWFVMKKTTTGYQLRAVGYNQRAARYAGMNVAWNTILALGLSGVFAGLAGGIQMLSADHRLTDSFNSGYGYTGIVVALLARNNPFGIILAAVFFSALNTGAQNVQMISNVPASLSDVLTGLIIFFVAAERIIPMLRGWFKRRGGQKPVAAKEG